MLDSRIEVNELELHSYFYDNFQTNDLSKYMNLLIILVLS